VQNEETTLEALAKALGPFTPDQARAMTEEAQDHFRKGEYGEAMRK
jgi:hypothetical protein